MKYSSISILCAALTASASAFVSPLVAKRTVVPIAIAPENACSALQAAQEHTVDEVVHDLLKMSNFIYSFADIRRIVKENEGQERKKRTGLFRRSERYTVAFDTPALILTQNGAQEDDNNQYLKYDITPDAIKLFIEKNRKWFYEPEGGGDWEFDKTVTEKTEPFVLEEKVEEATRDNLKIIDFDDEFSTKNGGFVYGVVVNLTRKWISVVFRGSVGMIDWAANRDFRLDHESLFESEDDIFIPGGKPGTHMGFTAYLCEKKKGDQDERRCIDRILACVNEEFKSNPDVAGKDFDLYVTGHSLGGAMGNLFSFKAAQLKAKGDESVKYLPEKITALTYAAPVVGNEDFNKEYQYLEKKGVLRHIRVANEGDVVPTISWEIMPPAIVAVRGSTRVYTQNGVNLFLLPEDEVKVGYRATKSFASQFGPSVVKNHTPGVHFERLELEANKKVMQQTVEELYKEAGEFTK